MEVSKILFSLSLSLSPLVCPNVLRNGFGEALPVNGAPANCYKIFRYKLNYTNAKQTCKDDGALLVSIQNQEENVRMYDIITATL